MTEPTDNFAGVPYPQPLCMISWGGFNLWGDKKSIAEVHRLMHAEQFGPYWRERYEAATAPAKTEPSRADSA